MSDRHDTVGMWDLTASLPEQVEKAARDARRVDGLPRHQDVEHVVVLGMGGSGIAGDLLMATAAPFMPVPVTVTKGYELPAFVGEGSLVFAISCSGNTEETLEAATDAALQGAKIVAITQGGDLAHRAEGWGAPVIPVPGDIPQPRAALGAMAIPPLVVLEDIGLFPGASAWIELAVDQLKRRRDQLIGEKSPAVALARKIGRTLPLVHGGGALGAAAAQRWKTQVNENAKVPAFWAAQPELCHNEVVGWGQHGDLTRQAITMVTLRHDGEHPQVARRFDLVADLVREAVSSIEEVRAEGEGELAQLLDLIIVGDFVSLEMAFSEGVDPGPVPILTDLKGALASGGGS
ncbi:MAG TPA: bifunctional phosphoglucose/phosphomannose isomerase [Acidimicrobiales bacterium]|nr:bifunctional phosphoglucose/phosphomannose isomerase [Acidimicrobiales bacterium]